MRLGVASMLLVATCGRSASVHRDQQSVDSCSVIVADALAPIDIRSAIGRQRAAELLCDARGMSAHSVADGIWRAAPHGAELLSIVELALRCSADCRSTVDILVCDAESRLCAEEFEVWRSGMVLLCQDDSSLRVAMMSSACWPLRLASVTASASIDADSVAALACGIHDLGVVPRGIAEDELFASCIALRRRSGSRDGAAQAIISACREMDTRALRLALVVLVNDDGEREDAIRDSIRELWETSDRSTHRRIVSALDSARFWKHSIRKWVAGLAALDGDAESNRWADELRRH